MYGRKPMLTSGIHFIWQLLHNSSNHQVKITAKYSGYMVCSYLVTYGYQQRNPQNDLIV